MKTQLINFSIPKELLKKLDEFAKKETRSRSEVLREAVRRLTTEAEKRRQDFAAIRNSAKRINLQETEAFALIDKIRSTLPINR